MGNHYARSNLGALTGKERRSAGRQVVQGTGSLIVKKALLEVDKLDSLAILLPMHDALIFEHCLPDTASKQIATFEPVTKEVLGVRIDGKATVEIGRTNV